MATFVASGSREEPIVLDDEDDEDDEIICLAGPSNLPHNISPIGHSLEEPIVLCSTPEPDRMDVVEYVIIDDDEQYPPGSLPYPEVDRLTPSGDRHLQASTGSSHSEIGPTSSSNQDDTATTETLKLKSTTDDNQESLQPASPSLISLEPAPSVDVAGPNKKMKTKPIKRLKAEREGSPAPLPERVSYKGPLWPSYIKRKSPIPQPGFGPLAYGGQPVGVQRPPISKPCKRPNKFGPPERLIGKDTSREPKRGMFPSHPHDPARTLVLGLIPRQFRSLDFVLQWCRDVSLPDDPAPLRTVVIRTFDKALVEFATPEQANRALNSPKMTNRDGRAQIVATWYRTRSGICHSSSKPPLGSATHERSAFLTPLFPEFDRSSNPSNGLFHPGLPFRQGAFFPTTPSSQSFPPVPLLPPPLFASPQPPAKRIDQITGHRDLVISDPLDSVKRDFEAKDAEIDEGEVREICEMDISEQTELLPHPSLQQSDLYIKSQQALKTSQPGSRSGSSHTSQSHCQDANLHPFGTDENTPVYQEGACATLSSERAQAHHGKTDDLGHPSMPDERLYPKDKAEQSPKSVDAKQRLLMKFQKYKASTSPPSNVPGPAMLFEGTTDIRSSSSLPDPSALASPSSISDRESLLMKEGGELTSSDMDVDQPGVFATLPQDRARTERKGIETPDAKTASQVQGDSGQELAELRERVLASRRRKVLALAATASPFTPTRSPFATTLSPNHTPFGNPSRSSTLSTSPLDGTDTRPSSVPTAASSSSCEVDLKSSSYFDRMASSFLEDVLGPLKPGVQPTISTEPEGLSRISLRKDAGVLLQEKQRRLEEHLSRSKCLLSQWEAAKEKPEKAKIMKLIKEEKSKFEAEQAAADAELRQLDSEKMAVHSKLKMRPPLRCWPQTKLDQLVITLSDGEDDE